MRLGTSTTHSWCADFAVARPTRSVDALFQHCPQGEVHTKGKCWCDPKNSFGEPFPEDLCHVLLMGSLWQIVCGTLALIDMTPYSSDDFLFGESNTFGAGHESDADGPDGVSGDGLEQSKPGTWGGRS